MSKTNTLRNYSFSDITGAFRIEIIGIFVANTTSSRSVIQRTLQDGLPTTELKLRLGQPSLLQNKHRPWNLKDNEKFCGFIPGIPIFVEGTVYNKVKARFPFSVEIISHLVLAQIIPMDFSCQ